MKKLLALVLALSFCFSLVPVSQAGGVYCTCTPTIGFQRDHQIIMETCYEHPYSQCCNVFEHYYVDYYCNSLCQRYLYTGEQMNFLRHEYLVK